MLETVAPNTFLIPISLNLLMEVKAERPIKPRQAIMMEIIVKALIIFEKRISLS